MERRNSPGKSSKLSWIKKSVERKQCVLNPANIGFCVRYNQILELVTWRGTYTLKSSFKILHPLIIKLQSALFQDAKSLFSQTANLCGKLSFRLKKLIHDKIDHVLAHILTLQSHELIDTPDDAI